MTKRYDLIGDIHGNLKPLDKLLIKLGYQLTDGAYKHPERTAIFLGDFIDRGHQQRGVINTVRAMIKAGSAQAVMGNHEYNALCFLTENPKNHGVYLRPRNNKNSGQHMAFCLQFSGSFCRDLITESFVDDFIG